MTIKYDETMDPEVAASLGDISNLGTVAMPPTLMRGSRGAAVTALQKFLNSFGYGLAVDGIFGAGTEAAVKAAQAKLKRAVTGKWTPEDDAALKAVNQSGIVDATPSDKAAIAKAAVVAQTPPAVITQPGAQPGAQPPAQPGQEVAPQGGDFMAKLKVWMQSPWYWVGIAGVGVGLWWLWKQSQAGGGARQVAAVETLALEDGLNGVKSKPKRKAKAKAKKKAPAKKAEPEADEEE